MCYVSFVIQFAYGWGYERIRGGVAEEGVRLMKNRREWKVPCLLYADDLVLCGESEESLRGLVERFGRVCKRRGLKVNVDKSKVMVVSEDSPQCEVMLDGE